MNGVEWLSGSCDRHAGMFPTFLPSSAMEEETFKLLGERTSNTTERNATFFTFFLHLNSIRKIKIADFYKIMLK